MKLDRIMWGIILLFIGGVLLLENFGIINFYWWSVWRFWPIFLIIAGVNILFNRNKSQIGSIVSIVVLLITLVLLFFKGQEVPAHKKRVSTEQRIDGGDGDMEDVVEQTFSQPYTDSVPARTVLNISGGGTSFDLKGHTDSLISATVQRRGGAFSLKNEFADSVRTLSFKMKGNSSWNVGDGGNNVDLMLNTLPVWEIHVNMGAGEVDFDLSSYKVREFSFDGGAAALDVKLGNTLPITDVKVKTGIADVKINIPMASGCRIKAKTGLSSRAFTGFTKKADGTFETSNYSASTNKIFINLDGGLSSFEVKRY
ncbi:putative membrane protein [Pedobacter sp. AK017]|uniref:LiaF transmembrane domain-containing protein n=1 Tax=Pedobacter sp. AK017 TaxID=2723073 RepID=UPI00161CD73D|nr:DUF5668 domain-containing protein [Pedobacter sp. AK017]MBB5440817.1 putative membrane protein [Pedobacter sp. AK017]